MLTDPTQRDWIVDPVMEGEEWAYAFAVVPAFLGFLLIAAETEITELVSLLSLER